MYFKENDLAFPAQDPSKIETDKTTGWLWYCSFCPFNQLIFFLFRSFSFLFIHIFLSYSWQILLKLMSVNFLLGQKLNIQLMARESPCSGSSSSPVVLASDGHAQLLLGRGLLFCLPFIANASSQPFPLFQTMPHFCHTVSDAPPTSPSPPSAPPPLPLPVWLASFW